MSSFSAVNSKYQNEIEVIPVYLLDWGWETSYNFDILEKELDVNQTYLVPQTMEFNPLSSWFNHQLFDENDLGKEKVFLQTNRMAEVNGMEFFEEEVTFDKIVIGRIIKMSKLVDNIEQALPMLLNTQSFEYHALTPTYHIEVKTILPLVDYLNDPNQHNLTKLENFKIKEGINGYQFNFSQLKSCKLGFFNKNSLIPYRLEAHCLPNNLIVIYTSSSEYSHQYYFVKRENQDNLINYVVRFYIDYFDDKDTYQLVNYELSAEEIDLLTLHNPLCKNFFAGS